MLVGVGDSITAWDEDMRDDPGVPYRPWAVWLAEALGLEPVLVARPGATAPEVAAELLGATPDRGEVGALFIGVNDVRSPEWDPIAFAAALDLVVLRLAATCRELVACTVPLDLGRPRAGAKVVDCNALIVDACTRHGARICRLEDVSGGDLMQDDAVHPTARGHLEIADRAARVLGVPLPSSPGTRP